jgi:hypothetical protein
MQRFVAFVKEYVVGRIDTNNILVKGKKVKLSLCLTD